MQAFWNVDIEIKSPSAIRLGQLEPLNGDPGHRVIQLAPGHYEVVFSGDPIEPAVRQRALGACADRKVVVRDLIFEMREAGRTVHGSVA